MDILAAGPLRNIMCALREGSESGNLSSSPVIGIWDVCGMWDACEMVCGFCVVFVWFLCGFCVVKFLFVVATPPPPHAAVEKAAFIMWAARRVVSRPMRSLLPWPRVGFVASGPILRSTRPFSYNALGPARDFEEEAAIAMIGDDAAHLTDKMRTESDELIELLFQEVLKPPDVDIYKKSEERGQLANLPHDPDEFFQARPRTPQNYCMLLRVHAAKGLVDEGVQAYHEAVQRGLLEPSVFTETALISLYGAKSKKELATVSFAPAR